MAEIPNISPNDKDLILARKIGQALPHLSKIQASSDPLLSTLFSYRNLSQTPVGEINSDSIWDSIHQQINRNSKTKKSQIHFLSLKMRHYAVAATILLAAFLGIFLYQNLSQPQLIAESQNTQAVVSLADGSEVTLRPYSKLYEIARSEKKASYELHGEAYFKVTKNANRTFSVITNRSKVEVLGTQFVLSDWGDAATVYLQEGQIEYTAITTNKSVLLRPGQSSTIDQAQTLRVAENANKQVYTDWMNDELIFENESFRNIFNELEQHFNVSINTKQEVSTERLSGSIPLDDLNSVLKDLELVLNGRFMQTGQKSYVFNFNE